MSFITLKLPSGVSRNGTKYQTKGRWYDSQLVRWSRGALQPIGGWAYQSDTTGPLALTGIPRGAKGWEMAGGRSWQAYGTVSTVAANNRLYAFSLGTLYEIEPLTTFVAANEDTTIGGAGSGYYGALNYSGGVYGVGQSTLSSVTEADIWHLDNFGSLLIACGVPSNNEMYQWDPSTPATRATLVANAPTSLRGIVVTPERFVVALGADGDARNVQWADRESLTTWGATASNEAGAFVLEGSGRLMRGLRASRETLLWTDAELWAMVFIGGLYVYSFVKRGSQCGLVAPLAVAETPKGHVWMGNRGFFIYDGYVRPLPCEVGDFVFADMNRNQRIKINCFVNHEFSEITWFYVSDSATEIDRYVTWNYEENHWSLGVMARTCGIEATTTTSKPVLLDASGNVYQHEIGYDHTINQSSAVPYAESGPVEIERGDKIIDILEILPDEKNLGDVEMKMYASSYPVETETQHGPYSSTEPTSVRLSGRQVRMRIQEKVVSDWRVGDFRLDVRMGGAR